MDTILLEDICNRIKAAEDPYNIMEWLEQDLIHIAILPKSEYPGLTANKTSSFYLAEYLEAYLEKGYQMEEIIEGIKIILCKMQDKMNKKSLINEIEYCKEEITKLENKITENEKLLLSLENV